MKRIPLKDTERYRVERFKQCKKAERQLAWLKSRKAGVGGSDMSTILGLNRYATPYGLWLEKTGRTEPEDISGKWSVIRGNALENELRKRFRANHPEMIITDGTDKQFISREKPYLRASLDGILQREDGSLGILEIKTAGGRRAGDWHDEDGNLRIPPYYLAQVEFYALVTGWTWGVVYAAIGDDEPVEIPFTADEEDMAAIDKAATEFWQHVTDGTPPELTGVDVDLAQSDLQPEGWERSEDGELEDLLNRIDGYRTEETAAKKARTACETRVKELIGADREGFITPRWKAGYTTIHYKAQEARPAKEAYDIRRFTIKPIKTK